MMLMVGSLIALTLAFVLTLTLHFLTVLADLGVLPSEQLVATGDTISAAASGLILLAGTFLIAAMLILALG